MQGSICLVSAAATSVVEATVSMADL